MTNLKNRFKLKYKAVLLLIAVALQSGGIIAARGTAGWQSLEVSLELNNVTLKHVFDRIEEQTQLVFAYNNEDVDNASKVSIHAQSTHVKEVLTEVLKNTGLTYEVGDRFIMIVKRDSHPLPGPSRVMQQPGTITGTVTDESGEPLIGVNIIVKENATGSITDIDGQFILQGVPGNATLVVSYIGYVTQEIKTGSRNVFSIILKEDTQALEEIVVVGYGIQKKETLSGSVASIKADEITTTKSENLVNSLQGKMPGLLIRQRTGEPGTFDNLVSIRGYGDPLIVIDGVPVTVRASSRS